MPLTNNSSFVPTMNEFAAHWTIANAQLGAAGPLTVAFQGFATMQSSLVGRRQGLEAQQETIQEKLNDVDTLASLLNIEKGVLRESLIEFVGLLDGYWPDTEFFDARPLVVGLELGQQKFLDPIKDMKTLWTRMESSTVPPGLAFPLVLSNGMTLATLGPAITSLENRYSQVSEAEFLLDFERKKRLRLQDEASGLLVTYRQAVEARCRALPDVLASLPRLTPLPGHTPDPVNASAVFVAPNLSRIVHDASTETELAYYTLEGNAGGTFHSEDAVELARHLPGDPREFQTDFALTQPGARASFVVAVILSTGNRKASAPMTVQRPV